MIDAIIREMIDLDDDAISNNAPAVRSLARSLASLSPTPVTFPFVDIPAIIAQR